MGAADTLLSLAALWAIAVLSPGPNMLFFTGVALSSSRRALLGAGLGILIGTALWGLAGLFGLLWLFELFPTLALVVKVLGGLYLAFIGFKLVRGSLRPSAPASLAQRAGALSMRKAFSLGLATNLSNPKSLVFVTSLLAVTHLAEAPIAVGLAGVALMSLISACYYCLFGLALKLTPLPRSDGRLKRAIGVAVGAAMMAFGARMTLDR
jgi:threonine/homoserine/homoserine lactone efflux protein